MNSSIVLGKTYSSRNFGIEWECLVDTFIEPYPCTSNHVKYFYITSDASIAANSRREDNNKYTGGEAAHYSFDVSSREFVSQPLPAKRLIKEIERFHKWLNRPIYTNDTCGIHIHVDKRYCTLNKAANIMRFYKSLTEEDRRVLFGRDTNDYCRLGGPKPRYLAVNITNKTTVELRMFASGPVAWAKYCVLMAEWLVENHNHLNIDAAYAAHDLFLK